jgi:hypothetical protein
MRNIRITAREVELADTPRGMYDLLVRKRIAVYAFINHAQFLSSYLEHDLRRQIIPPYVLVYDCQTASIWIRQ